LRKTILINPRRLFFETVLRLNKRYGSDQMPRLRKGGAGRSATAGLRIEKLAEESERITSKKSVPDQSCTKKSSNEKS
jgi:hypothetical protein